jgi:hypothetical protein
MTRESAALAHEKRTLGAYGLRLVGVDQARRLLVPANPEWPLLRLRRRKGLPSRRSHDVVTETRAEFRLRTGGEIVVDWPKREAVYTTPRPVRPSALVHPFLAPVAAVAAYWLGRESFHAGAAVLGHGSWGIVGDRGAGKSTLLAQMALMGLPILCDDMLIVEGDDSLAGPRSVDLRGSAARRLGVGEAMGRVGARERWRLRLDRVEEAPLSGWVYLRWGDRLGLREMSARERIERLSAQRGLRMPARNPEALLDLVSRPSFELIRPRSWSSLEPSVELLADLAG